MVTGAEVRPRPRRAVRRSLRQRCGPALQRLGAAAAVTAILAGLGVVAHTGLTASDPGPTTPAVPSPRDPDELLRANRDALPRADRNGSRTSPTPTPTKSYDPEDVEAEVIIPRGDTAGPCASGSAVESGLTQHAIWVHREVCHRWPEITRYGGVRADALPDHPSGRALDIMITDSATGWAIANHLRANAGRLGISQIIFEQRIWTTQRAGEGWRWMADRGGTTANHYDHVHVSVH